MIAPIEPPWPLVTPDDDGIRPAGQPDACFYCKSKVGAPHGPDCVMVVKESIYSVLVDGREVGAFRYDDPYSWDDDMCEFHKNDGSWCASNAIDDIEWTDAEAEQRVRAMEQESDCVCPLLEFRLCGEGNPGPFTRPRVKAEE